MKQQTILITGATAGIGRHTALHLARKGHRVFATGRNRAALGSLEKEAAELPLETLRLDVTDAGSIADAARVIDAATDGDGVDVVVNNAGFGVLGPMAEISDEHLRLQFETNVFGLHAVTRAFLPKMIERRSGRVINVSSIGGRMTLPFFGIYNATKYAVESMSDALRRELAPFGVRVSVIEPGYIRTEFAATSMGYLEAYNKEDSVYRPVLETASELEKQAKATAVGPECIAEAIEHAATARRPRLRYVAPFRARILLGLILMLPTRWVDAVMQRLLGLTPKRLLPPAKSEATATA